MGSFRSEGGYREAREWLNREERRLAEERDKLEEKGLTEDEVRRYQEVAQAKWDWVSRDVQAHQDSLLSEFEDMSNMEGLGRMLVALRLAKGITVGELAERLGVPEWRVVYDEGHDYRDVSIEQVEATLRALGVWLITQIELLG